MAKVNWKIDTAHSEVQFKVKHLMITTVTGNLTSFNLDAETEDNDFTKASRIEFTADLNSISTNNEQRDAHLKSPDFFDTANYPQIKFVGKKYSQKDDDEYTLEGDLTIKGITKHVKLDVEYGGIVVDPYGQTKAGFTVKGKISRKEFDLTWSAVTEAGSLVVGDEIKINCEVQLIKQA